MDPTIADPDNFKHLGNKIKIVKGANGYTAIITEKGNNILVSREEYIL